MSGNVIIPRHYLSKLELLETEVAIKAAKDTFEAQLSAALGLTRVSAPLFEAALPGQKAALTTT